MPLNLVVAYVQEDMEVIKTFATLKSVSVQYKVMQGEDAVLYQGTSTRQATADESTSLVHLGEPRFTDLLSDEPLPSILDAHLDMLRCMHHDFDMTCPLPADMLEHPVFVEFTLVAFCSRQDSPYPEREYLYIGPLMKIPLLPVGTGYDHNMLIAAAKPPYLLRSELEHLERHMEECKELEPFLADGEWTDLPKHVQFELVL
ncbi:hypothetical protein APHAL10511_003426 [Amanita phalloides]|nr:hypothetical protein APHAL10511_003426 [Amanita phalloides]